MRIPTLNSLIAYHTANSSGHVPAGGAAFPADSASGRPTPSRRRDVAQEMVVRRLRCDRATMNQRSDNALHAITMIQAADEALARMDSILGEMADLAQQAPVGVHSESELADMQSQLDGMVSQLDAVPASVAFRGTNLLTASSAVSVYLGEQGGQASSQIEVPTPDMSAQGLGLKVTVADPTYATLTASSDHGVANPNNIYMAGPKKEPAAELTFNFDGPSGDKTITVEILKNQSLNDIVGSINAEAEALVPGWMAAEAVQVAGLWLLKTMTYEPGESDAPEIAVSGDLTWGNGDPILPSHFAGEGGSAASTGAPDVADASTLQTIENAVAAVADLRGDYAASIHRLEIAHSTLASAATSCKTAETRISDPDAARELASSMRGELASIAEAALLLQANVMWEAALHLLSLPSVAGPTSATNPFQ